MSEAPVSEVLFICTGNYYRSRFAEAMFNHLAAQRGLPWRAFSRGVAIHLAPPGLSAHTAAALQARGLPLTLTPPERQSLTAPDLERAARAIALKEAEHRAYIRQQLPAWEDRVEYWHFHDLDVAGSEEVLPAIEARVGALIEELADQPA